MGLTEKRRYRWCEAEIGGRRRWHLRKRRKREEQKRRDLKGRKRRKKESVSVHRVDRPKTKTVKKKQQRPVRAMSNGGHDGRRRSKQPRLLWRPYGWRCCLHLLVLRGCCETCGLRTVRRQRREETTTEKRKWARDHHHHIGEGWGRELVSEAEAVARPPKHRYCFLG